MTPPSETAISEHFLDSLYQAQAQQAPYPHWLLSRCLPDAVADAVTALPVAPARIGDTRGRRETHNATRIHFGPEFQRQHAIVATLARVFQSRWVVEGLKAVTGAPLAGTSLRIEYCQDTEGFWLEPHTDIGVKQFTMLIYLNREPHAVDWGTDIYSDAATRVGRAPAPFNSGLIFVPSDTTWHAFDKRPIDGVRKSLILNYVGPAWQSRHELCFPHDPIA
jgi:hypothetical protein